MGIKIRKEAPGDEEVKSGSPQNIKGSVSIDPEDIGDICYIGPCINGSREIFYFTEEGCTDGPYYTSDGCDGERTEAASLKVNWAKKDSTNAKYYFTKDVIPKGTLIKIFVAAAPETLTLSLREMTGGPVDPPPFREETPVTNSVISATLSKNMKFSIEVGGLNFWREGRSVIWDNDKACYIMKLDKGWVLHIKLEVGF